MQRIALCTSVAVLILSGCHATSPRAPLGPLPNPILATRTPAVVPPPVVEPVMPQPPPTVRSLQGATIVVDPGHGGDDPGATGYLARRQPLLEKSVNLAIAQGLVDHLRDRGAQVVMTRSSDRFIALDSRALVADRNRADLFVSIHADSARRTSVSGITLYVARGASGSSRRAANCIAAAIQRAGLEFRGVQSAGFRVLVAHSRPAVLVECGFLSNRSEVQLLSTSAHRSRIAQAIAEGVADYASR